MSNSNLEQAVIDLMYLQVDEAIQESDIVSQHQYDIDQLQSDIEELRNDHDDLLRRFNLLLQLKEEV
jgi:hypothetical protein